MVRTMLFLLGCVTPCAVDELRVLCVQSLLLLKNCTYCVCNHFCFRAIARTVCAISDAFVQTHVQCSFRPLSPRNTNPTSQQQAFDLSGQRLCVTCCKAVPGGNPNPGAVLNGPLDLFCSGACEGGYYVRMGGGAIRRALFKLERGVCQVRQCCWV